MGVSIRFTRSVVSVAAISLSGALPLAQSDWRQLPVAVGPPPRLGHAMAYDSWRDRIVLFDARRSRIVMFGGHNYDSATWEHAMTRPAWFMT